MASNNPLPTEVLEFHCRVMEAKGLKNHQMMGKMDPFVIVRINTTEQRSQVAPDGHTTPTWNFKSMLNATINDQAYVNVINKAALGADELIGTALLSVASLIDGQVADIWLTLRKGSEVTGEIHVRAQLMRSGERPIGKAAELAAAGKSALAAGFGAPVPAPAPAPMAAPPPQYAQPAPSPYQQAPPPGYAAYPQQAPPPAAYPPAYPGAPSYAPAPAPAYGAPMPGYGMAPPPMMPVPMPVPVPVASMMPVPQYGVAPPPMGYPPAMPGYGAYPGYY